MLKNNRGDATFHRNRRQDCPAAILKKFHCGCGGILQLQLFKVMLEYSRFVKRIERDGKMKRTIGTIFISLLLSMFLFGGFASAEVKEISVDLKQYINNASSVDVELKGDYYLEDGTVMEEGKNYQVKTDGQNILFMNGTEKKAESRSFTLTPEKYEDQYIKINDQSYLGNMKFQSDKRGSSYAVLPTNTLLFEDYLKGVVPREMSDSTGNTDAEGNSGLEALKAQAIIARTFAQARMDRTLEDTTNDQVYGGLLDAPNSIKAVNETVGEVLTYDGKLFETFYSASNGGIVQSNVNAWGGSSLPYLQKRTDDYDPKPEWNFDIKRKDAGSPVYNIFENLVKRHGGDDFSSGDVKVKDIINIVPLDFDSNERILMEVEALVEKNGSSSTLKFTAPVYELRIELLGSGISGMGSHVITDVKVTNNAISLKGKGLGHGVGLSQRGAIQRALNGYSDQSILAFYFPNALIEHNGDQYDPDNVSWKVPSEPDETKEDKMSLKEFYADVNPGNDLRVTVSTSRSGNLEVHLKKDGEIVETLQERAWLSAGENSYSFDASELEGTYTVSVRAADADSNVVNESKSVSFDDLSKLITSMDIISKDRKVEITYETARNSNVSINILDENDELIEELKSRSWDKAGKETISWDPGELSGEFTFELRAADGMQVDYETKTVTIEELKKLEDMIELTNVEYKDGKVIVAFTSETGANLSIDLLDNNDQKIKELKSRSWDSAGSYEIEWEVEDVHGGHVVQLRAADGNEVIFKEESVEIPSPLSAVINDIKLEDREVLVSYETMKNANVSIEVYDKDGSHVDTMKERSWDQAGKNTVTWDAGTYTGTHTFKLRAADGSKVVYEEKSLEIPSLDLITKTAVDIENRRVSFTYETMKNANVSIEVYDKDGSHVDTMKERSWDQAGENTATWDAGSYAGKYTFELRAADGNEVVYEEKSLEIPEIGLAVVDEVKIDSKEVEMHYTTYNNANVSVTVYDSQGKKVKDIKERTWDKAGSSKVNWNTESLSGEYTIELRAADGNEVIYLENDILL